MSKVMNINLVMSKIQSNMQNNNLKITYNSEIYKSKEIDLRGGKFIREGGHYVIPINRPVILAL